jgi:methylated-DNA-[protein]-cysteine S-methyltransferase
MSGKVERTGTAGLTNLKHYLKTPLGILEVVTAPASGHLASIDYLSDDMEIPRKKVGMDGHIGQQLKEYFNGKRQRFETTTQFEGTPFQVAVWREIAKIPYGETITYGDIAKAIGKPRACQAVGAACGKNPISIVVPCHRVVGHSGALTGYAGGLWRKQWLLDFEQKAGA